MKKYIYTIIFLIPLLFSSKLAAVCYYPSSPALSIGSNIHWSVDPSTNTCELSLCFETILNNNTFDLEDEDASNEKIKAYAEAPDQSHLSNACSQANLANNSVFTFQKPSCELFLLNCTWRL
jgi:hypothetical protein